MSVLKDVLDTLSAIDGTDITRYLFTQNSKKSLAKESLTGTFNFPVIADDSLSIEDGMLVSKALEKEYSTFTMMVLTMNPYIPINGKSSTAPSAERYLKQFHQNIDIKVDGTDILNTAKQFMQECLYTYDIDPIVLENATNTIVANIFENVNCQQINLDNVKWNYTIEDVTNDTLLNDKLKSGGYKVIYETKRDKSDIIKQDLYNITNKSKGTNDLRKMVEKDEKSQNKKPFNINVNVGGSKGGNSGGLRYSYVPPNDPRQLERMLDNDVKKSNELVPTLLYIRTFPMDKNTGEPYPPIDFILGIKATLHPVSSDEMIINLARGIKNDDAIFNFIRWTTGEISFLKDFVFHINELKLDALNTGRETSKWWTVLKRRKALARIKSVFLPEKLLPNATFMISKSTVDILRREFGYDLLDYKIAYRLIDHYFLLGIVIVDDALQRANFLFDGRTEFDTYTFATLARENTVDDKKFKEMINMLGRRM